MKYVQINTFRNGSTGAMMRKLHEKLLSEGHESYIAFARGGESYNSSEILIGNLMDVYTHGVYARITGRVGFASRHATRKLLARLDEIGPDVVHLHNLHGYYIDVDLLFKWLAIHDCRVKWTLHDCWAFTGHCAHFTCVNCDKWMRRCDELCPQLSEYPKTFSKASVSWNYDRKSDLFTMLPSEKLELVSPSRWLAGLTRQSFLRKYPVIISPNTVDATVYKPVSTNVREHLGIEKRFMILGVASSWSERKGLFDFDRLANELDPTRFAVVLVGLSKKQMRSRPENAITLMRTESIQELVELYSAADVFFNPTQEDNYPTVNLEAQACGTPVFSYDVGGCAETLSLHGSSLVTFEQFVDIVELRASASL